MKTTNKYVDRDNFSQIIRHKLENYSLPIDAGSWNELEKRLNAKPAKKIALWPWISGVSAAASIVLAITFLHTNEKELNHGTTNLSYHAEGVIENVQEKENLSSVSLPSIQTQTTRQQSRQKPPVSELLAFRQPDVISSEETVQENTDLSVAEEIIVPETRPVNPDSRPETLLSMEEFIAPWKSKNKTKSVALRLSSGGRLYTVNNTFLAAANASSPGLRSSDISKNSLSVLSEDLLSSEDFDQIEHYPPMAIGMSIRKALNDYLAVESGLTYTYLYTTFENKIPRQDASLTLHYLGIPVNLAVNMYPYSRSRWNVYFSAGGMVEKGLLSHYVQNTYSGTNNVAATTTSNERILGLQWSVQAAIGLSYRFNKDYSVFLEPKIIYYLDNNQPFNIRTEHPFVPGINLGLRHTW